MSSISLTVISKQFSVYGGFFIFIFGVTGYLVKIRLLFPTCGNSCSFLLLVSSFFNLLALSAGLLPRVLTIGFGIDPSSSSLFCCESRLFISYTGTITSITCLCFAAIERLLVSCPNITWRHRSQLRAAIIVLLIAILIIIAMNTPYILFYTIVEVTSTTTENTTTTKCSPTNTGLILYGTCFVRPALFGLLPGTLLKITGWLIYRNITTMTGVQLRGTFQRRLTSMIFFQIIIPIIPFAMINIYQLVTVSTSKTAAHITQETFVLEVANVLLYISYASNFYVYLLSSSVCRRDFRRLVFCDDQRSHRTNQVRPLAREHLRLRTVLARRLLPQRVP